MYNCGFQLNFNGTYMEFTVLMVFLNCTVNPFIYLIKYRDYQETLKNCFNCNKKKEGNNSLNSSISNPTRLTDIESKIAGHIKT